MKVYFQTTTCMNNNIRISISHIMNSFGGSHRELGRWTTSWDPALDTCTGKIIKLDHAQVDYATVEAKRQLGGNWRLPTRAELESLVCDECPPPKIKSRYFPNISPEAYWTGDKNIMNSRMFWSVNFMTGHSYSRFFPYQALPVLLVEAN